MLGPCLERSGQDSMLDTVHAGVRERVTLFIPSVNKDLPDIHYMPVLFSNRTKAITKISLWK